MSNTRALLSDCTALPAPDPEPGQRCFAELPADIRERLHPHEAFLVSVFSCAPYLARLAQRGALAVMLPSAIRPWQYCSGAA